MSSPSDITKILFVIEKIDDLLSYKQDFKSVENLLNSKMGFDATNMCIMQIGETLNKLSPEIQSQYAELPIKESYLTRNYIAHDYEGVNKHIIEMIIRDQLPKLQLYLEALIKEIQK